MTMPFTRAPHLGVGGSMGSGSPNAALLIDFDNVTMGMRSDLSKDLKKLLQSDIIKGKVTVQRAYADWRRYPQYIVPLSEASIDLIFAPAYGSSKKNATDIRMAIDGMELVFTRPEIGTFILLTGDSDFSSLVLKLKEYGKYVIGVGIQESSSDILVQNCDEYYSYTSLTGLRKTTDTEHAKIDPWVLVEKAVGRMAERDDVMRSDRLKQVMIELDPGFDEGDFGYSKFSRFLSEAASKGLVQLRKLENGQYEIGPSGAGRPEGGRGRREEGREPRARAGGDRGPRSRGPRARAGEAAAPPAEATPAQAAEPQPISQPPNEAPEPTPSEPPLAGAYDLLRRTLESLREQGRETVRDSDVKRKMLDIDASFDENQLGFSKFSRFLRQAHDREIIDLHKRDGGNYEVSLRTAGAPAPTPEPSAQAVMAEEAAESVAAEAVTIAPEPEAVATERPRLPEKQASRTPAGLGPRRGSTRRRRDDSTPPPVLEGQVPSIPSSSESATAAEPVDAERTVVADVAPEAEKVAPKKRRSRARKDKSAPKSEDAAPEAGTAAPAESPLSAAGLDALGSPSEPEAQPPETEDATPASEAAAPTESPRLSAGLDTLGLPSEPEAQIRYLTHSYRGVGRKTAESLVESFGPDLFRVLQNEPERLAQVVPANRADQVLEGWQADFARRSARGAESLSAPATQPPEESQADSEDGQSAGGRRRNRRGGRRGGGGRERAE